jgi:hypothetical protein
VLVLLAPQPRQPLPWITATTTSTSTTAAAATSIAIANSTHLLARSPPTIAPAFNQRSAVYTAPLHINADGTPEDYERFWFRMVSVVLIDPSGLNNQGPSVTSTNEVVVWIAPNDNWNGRFSLSSGAPLTMVEGATPPQTVAINRDVSTAGTSTVSWEIVDSSGLRATTRFASASGQETFGPGQSQASFDVSAVNDGIVELAESFTLRIVSSTNVTSVANPSSTVITIPSDALVGGTIGLNSVGRFSLFEGEQRVVSVSRVGTELPAGAVVNWTIAATSANAHVNNLVASTGAGPLLFFFRFSRLSCLAGLV